jgi:hypothetical protein
MSNNLDWKKLISTVAPTIGVMLGGPMAGTAVSALSNLFLGNPDGTESELSEVIQTGLTPEKIAELQKLDIEHKEFMAKLGFDYAKLNQESELAYVEDTKDARKYKDPSVFAMGIAILVAFSITMILALIGAYQILSGGIIIKDISVVAGIAGFVGTVIGYVASSAQQVIGYFFGSSAGSVQKTSAMAESFKSAMDSSKK